MTETTTRYMRIKQIPTDIYRMVREKNGDEIMTLMAECTSAHFAEQICKALNKKFGK